MAEDLEALSVQQEMTVTERNESKSQTTSITFEDKEKVRQVVDLEQYRMKLHGDLGRSTVGSTGLCSGFSIELIPLVLQHIIRAHLC